MAMKVNFTQQKKEIDKMKNEQVVANWINGIRCNSLHLSTDGNSIFSYDMKIGETQEETKGINEGLAMKVGLNVQSPNFYSNTTSHHVGLVKRYADKMTEPVSIRKGFSLWYLFP